MFNLFVWLSFGEISVYEADTDEKLEKIYKLMCDCISDWESEEIDSCILNSESKTPKQKINMLLEIIDVGSCESFEYNTGFISITTL